MEKVNTLRAKRAEEEPAVQQGRHICHELSAENRELKKTVNKYSNENDNLSKHEKELKEKMVIFQSLTGVS